MRERVLLRLRSQGDRIVGLFCGQPRIVQVHARGQEWSACPETSCERCAGGEAPTFRALYNLFVADSGTLRVLDAEPPLLADLLKVGRKYGLVGMVFEVERRDGPGEVGARYSILPEGKAGVDLLTAARSTPLWDLQAIAADPQRRLPAPAPAEPGVTAGGEGTAAAGGAAPSVDLAMDLRQGLRFAHGMAMQTRFGALQAKAQVNALVEELLAAGHLDLEAFQQRLQRVEQREAERFHEGLVVRMADPVDKYALGELPAVDCQARMPICKSRCCKLVFPLGMQDLDEGVVEWDYALPYMARKGADGLCVHRCTDSGGCLVYEHRPAICRTYSCREDRRIWADFDAMILASPDTPGSLS